MTAEVLRLGFLGFGEAASRFAKDLAEAGLRDIVAYSPSASKGDADHPSRMKAAQAGVVMLPSVKEVCQRSSVIIALPPGSRALAVVRKARPHLRPDQLYVDASTSSVKDMEEAARMLDGVVSFVDAAVMDPVPMNGIKTHTVASGAGAERFRTALSAYGMNIQVVGERPGAASAMKLLRSVCMKGFAALLIEALEGAQRYGITDALAADTMRFIDSRPFEQIMKRWVCGTAIHAERRIHEMSESLALLQSIGASTRMTRATREMLRQIVDMGLRERFDAREPSDMASVLDAIIEAKSAKAAGSQA